MGYFISTWIRLAPRLCISHSTKSDIHWVIINTLDEWENLLSGEPNSGKKSFSPHIISKTKGFKEESLYLNGRSCKFYTNYRMCLSWSFFLPNSSAIILSN